MENSFFVRNALWLKIDFWVQAILISISTCFIFLVLFALAFYNDMLSPALIGLLYSQIIIGAIQLSFSIIPHFVLNNPLLNNHRKIHFFVGMVVLIALFFADPENSNKSITKSIILWTQILALPQILMYYYFWITWHYFKKVS